MLIVLLHCINVEIEAQRGSAAHPRSHSQRVAEPGLETKTSDFKLGVVTEQKTWSVTLRVFSPA